MTILKLLLSWIVVNALTPMGVSSEFLAAIGLEQVALDGAPGAVTTHAGEVLPHGTCTTIEPDLTLANRDSIYNGF